MMNLELLPNEIFLDIFDYLNGVDLLCAFYGLNTRFNLLLYKQYRAYRFKFENVSKRDFDMVCQQHLPLIANRIISLDLANYGYSPQQINLFLSYVPSFRQFTHLRSLSLSRISSYQTLIKLIDQCQYLCNLIHLKILYYYFGTSQHDYQILLDNIWSLPKLIYYSFNFLLEEKNIYCTPTKISSTLEYVKMQGYLLKWNQINRFFEYTPCCKSLSIFIRSDDIDDYKPSPLPTLMDLNIRTYGASDTLKMRSLLENLPSLRNLNISLWFNLINGDRWEQIIRTYLPKLQVFRLRMEDPFYDGNNIQERADQLFESFRSSFWIDEHKWFVRCTTKNKTIHLCTASGRLHYYDKTLYDSWRSTCPQNIQKKYYNNMTTIWNTTFFDHPISSDIRMPNLNVLWIKFPIHDQFWSIVPNLNRLSALKVSSYTDTFQSQLKIILDQAPHLFRLTIHQDATLPLQMSIFKCIAPSVRRLDLQSYNYQFNEEECITLTHSPLSIQCHALHIQVKNRESIIILVKHMINLRVLHVQCEDEKQSGHIQSITNDDESHDRNASHKDDLVEWLKDRLPSTCSIVQNVDDAYRIRIWIY